MNIFVVSLSYLEHLQILELGECDFEVVSSFCIFKSLFLCLFSMNTMRILSLDMVNSEHYEWHNGDSGVPCQRMQSEQFSHSYEDYNEALS